MEPKIRALETMVVVIEYPDFEYSVKNYDAAFQADGKIIIAGHLGGAEGKVIS